MEAIEKLSYRLRWASVVDRVVEKVIALLCVHAGVEAVYACAFSEKAKAVLKASAIYHEWNKLVDNVQDSKKWSLPFREIGGRVFKSKRCLRKA
ncbi:MAG: DUF1893 domain-containing protein [Candidatus Bathyarchaeota archaeon]|nr:DUF1893 domain-containing protein [Candidatus Bathyarchaeota archaeon]MDH5787894.1 DUF1893 domain-containing protein [Candidatus Bathyarchaeota archaeon]